MKCPKCGQELTPGKKDPSYLLCYNCKKKYKVPQKVKQEQTQEVDDATTVVSSDTEVQKYSNIPSKEVREKRETEMRKAYDELLAVENGKKKKKKKKKPEPIPEPEIEENYDDEYDDVYDDDEHLSKAPIIILAIAIVAVGALIACMVLL